jgi:hypothetical protein
MPTDLLETRAHTTPAGRLQLDLDIGVADADVVVTVHVMPPKGAVDANGWPIGYFEELAATTSDLTRPPQGEFEERTPLG